MPIPTPDSPYARPHAHLPHYPWEPWAAKLTSKLLSWHDVKQMTVFGRNGYYVANYLFAALPVQEPLMEVWVRLGEADAAALAKDPRGSAHEHGVKGWMKYRVDGPDQIDAAASWLEKAHANAVAFWQEGEKRVKPPAPEGPNENPLGVPIALVPEATGKPDHIVPQGPRSGKLNTGLVHEGSRQPSK